MSKTSIDIPPFLVKDKGELFRLFRDVVVLPSEVAIPIIKQFYRWLSGSGPEWTIARMKDLKTLYLQHKAGNLDFRLEKESRIKLHKDGTPYGAFRALWKLEGHKNVSKVLTILQIYTNVKLVKTTRKQLDKFYNGVFAKPLNHGSAHISLPKDIIDLYKRGWDSARYDKLDRWTSGRKMVITPSPVTKWGYDPFKTVPENELSNDRHIADYFMLCTPLCIDPHFRRLHEMALQDDPALLVLDSPALMTSLYSSYQEPCRVHFPFHVNKTLGAKPYQDSSYDMYGKFDPTGKEEDIVSDLPIVGKIGFIQERGGKLRAVANPLRVIQVVLSKFHNYLMQVAKSLPFDCTHDQFEGVRWAQKKLRDGETLYSFDLSDASSTIPLSDQLYIFKQLGPSHHREEYLATLDYFERVARGIWFDKHRGTHFGDHYPYTRWWKGQALGSLLSFPGFAQNHGLRCVGLCVNLGLDPLDNFRVLGDDIVVTSKLSTAYEHFVTVHWECDISKSKTLVSDRIGEFASKVITADRLLANPKFSNGRCLFDPLDPLDVLRRYGKKGIQLVPKGLRYSVKVLSCLPKPVGMSYTYKEEEFQHLDPRLVAKTISSNELPKPLLNCAIVQIEDPGKSSFRAPSRGGFVIYPRQRANREQDLKAAFSPTTQHCYLKYFSKTYINNANGVTLDPGTFVANRRKRFMRMYQKSWNSAHDYVDHELVGIQWLILHLNANMDNKSAFIRSVRDELSEEHEALPKYPVPQLDERGSQTSGKKIRSILKLVAEAISIAVLTYMVITSS
jgi:hypothetical protein